MKNRFSLTDGLRCSVSTLSADFNSHRLAALHQVGLTVVDMSIQTYHAANQACKTTSLSAEVSSPIHRRATANLSTFASTRSAMNFEGAKGSHEFEREERSTPLIWSPVACLTWIAIRAIPNPTRHNVGDNSEMSWLVMLADRRSAANLLEPVLISEPTEMMNA